MLKSLKSGTGRFGTWLVFLCCLLDLTTAQAVTPTSNHDVQETSYSSPSSAEGYNKPKLNISAGDNVAYQGSFPISTASGLTQAVLIINGESRVVLVYRPSGATPQPLLILYGGTGSTLAYNIADELGRDTLQNFADRENVVILVPMQRVMTWGDWDNHSAGTPYWETAVDDSTASVISNNPDSNPDLLLTRALIQEAAVRYSVDLKRVYVNGFSNGAFFSYFVAATLNNRIAAFAETGGGLVLSNTTAGNPIPCTPQAPPTSLGSVRSCSEAGWTPNQCSYSGATPRPIAPSSVSHVPAGFMEANDDDDSVPFYHTCNLSNALSSSNSHITRITHTNNGHSINGDFLDNSWNFMKNHLLAEGAAPVVVEFYNVNLDNYFITADANEAAGIDNGSAGPGWSRTGNTFKSGGATSVCRFYGSQSPGPNSHFYTADAGECAYLKQLQAETSATQKRWNFESNDFLTTVPTTPGVNGSCSAGTTPVYRAYNNGFARGVDSNHRIASSLAAIQQVVGRGWDNEGVVMCAPQ